MKKKAEENKYELSVEPIIAAILNGKKYKNILPDLIRFVSESEIPKHKKQNNALKAVRNRLHQSAAAYIIRQDYAVWLNRLKEHVNSKLGLMNWAEQVMRFHVSTKERLPVLYDFYKNIFALIPDARVLMDIGCGLNPLSVFWMPVPGNIRYIAYDIYEDMTAFLNEFFNVSGINGHAETQDFINKAPEIKTDAVFLLKMIPVFEQLKPGLGMELIGKINAKYFIVSFPTKTIGRKEKGMRNFYSNNFLNLISEMNWEYKKIDFPLEIVFIISKSGTFN